MVTLSLKMASPGFTAIKSTSASGLVLILPVWGQKVKGIGPSALEEGIRDREQEPAGASNGPTIATSFGHDLNTLLKEQKGLNGINMRT